MLLTIQGPPPQRQRLESFIALAGESDPDQSQYDQTMPSPPKIAAAPIRPVDSSDMYVPCTCTYQYLFLFFTLIT